MSVTESNMEFEITNWRPREKDSVILDLDLRRTFANQIPIPSKSLDFNHSAQKKKTSVSCVKVKIS